MIEIATLIEPICTLAALKTSRERRDNGHRVLDELILAARKAQKVYGFEVVTITLPRGSGA